MFNFLSATYPLTPFADVKNPTDSPLKVDEVCHIVCVCLIVCVRGSAPDGRWHLCMNYGT